MREPLSTRVTVVVITCDRIAELARSLDRLAELPERPPVIVIDNGSRPAVPRHLVDRRDDWQLIRLPANEGGAARNIGVATAVTPYVAFNDDDTWWEPGSLDRAADVLDANPSVAVVTARIVVEPNGAEDPICAELADSPLSADGVPGPVLGSFLAGASVVRRSAFLEVGGFERRLFIGGEEELLSTDLRVAGWRLVYLPELLVHHHPSTSRDPDLQRRLGIRNHLWLLWLRRPWGSVARRTWSLLGRSPLDRHSVAAVLDALAGAPWVLRRRRRIPAVVEREQRLLDREQDRSFARRYVS